MSIRVSITYLANASSSATVTNNMQGIESIWALIKRGHKGVYNSMSPKHMHRYLAEYTERFNARDLSPEDHMAEIVNGAEGKRLRYAELTAGAKWQRRGA